MIKLLYIASPSYSGSTLLTMLLNRHPEIATIGELKWGCIDITTYRCSCGELLRECPFWIEVQSRVEGQGLPFDLRRPATDFRFPDNPLADRVARARNRGPMFEAVRHAVITVTPVGRERWPTIAAINHAAIEAVLDLQEGSVFLDGSKDPVRLMHLIATGDYDTHVIQLIRDGRGVMGSTMKNKRASAEVGASDWRQTHEQIERITSRLGANRTIVVRYEDLCADPMAEIGRILRLIGLDPADTARLEGRRTQHILGNNMRLRAEPEVRLDEKWRTQVDPADLAIFEDIAGAMNRRYGYE